MLELIIYITFINMKTNSSHPILTPNYFKGGGEKLDPKQSSKLVTAVREGRAIEKSKILLYLPKFYLNNINKFRQNKNKDKDLIVSHFFKLIYYYICMVVFLLILGIFIFIYLI